MFIFCSRPGSFEGSRAVGDVPAMFLFMDKTVEIRNILL